MPRSSSRPGSSKRKGELGLTKKEEFDPKLVDIPAALRRLRDCLTPNPVTNQVRVRLKYTFNPAVPPEHQRHEDRTDLIRSRFIERMIRDGAILKAGELEWCAVNATKYHNSPEEGEASQDGDLAFVIQMLKDWGLLAAIQAQKIADDKPLKCLSAASRSTPHAAPDAAPAVPAGALSS